MINSYTFDYSGLGLYNEIWFNFIESSQQYEFSTLGSTVYPEFDEF